MGLIYSNENVKIDKHGATQQLSSKFKICQASRKLILMFLKKIFLETCSYTFQALDQRSNEQSFRKLPALSLSELDGRLASFLNVMKSMLKIFDDHLKNSKNLALSWINEVLNWYSYFTAWKKSLHCCDTSQKFQSEDRKLSDCVYSGYFAQQSIGFYTTSSMIFFLCFFLTPTSAKVENPTHPV